MRALRVRHSRAQRFAAVLALGSAATVAGAMVPWMLPPVAASPAHSPAHGPTHGPIQGPSTGAPPVAPVIGVPAPQPQPATSGVSLSGAGSALGAPEVSLWSTALGKAPIGIDVAYAPSSSGDGRAQFAGGHIDFAMTDIPYQPAPLDPGRPTDPFAYLPLTAGAIAFEYHLDGLESTLRLSPEAVCAIFTGAVARWNDPLIARDNPGVNLPDAVVHPVIRTDLAGTNFVLEEYCIDEVPGLWGAFVASQAVRQMPDQVGDLSPDQPRSDWPLFPSAVPAVGAASAAEQVALSAHDGYITPVATWYAMQSAMPVAAVENASGVFTTPSPVGIASALAYAHPEGNGIRLLDFAGTGATVYNPSLLSYMVVPTGNVDPAHGAALSQLVDYAATVGQQAVGALGYASPGRSVETYDLASVATLPGAVAPTPDEQAAVACGDFTSASAQAGATGVTCPGGSGSTSAAPVDPVEVSGTLAGLAAVSVDTRSGAGAGAGVPAGSSVGSGGSDSAASPPGAKGDGGSPGVSLAPGGSGVPGGPGSPSPAGTIGVAGSGTGLPVDPSVTLALPPAVATGPSTLSFTGGNPLPLAVGGALLIAGACAARRMVLGSRASRLRHARVKVW